MSHTRRVRRSITQGLMLLQVDVSCTHFQIWNQHSQSSYLVTAEPDRALYCECRDFEIHHHKCKHILFVLGRVLNLTPAELEALDPRAVLSETVRDRLINAAATFVANRTRPQNRPVDDTCGICMEPFHAGSVVCDCHQCWHTCHHTCLQQWHVAAKLFQHACPYCRREFQISLPYIIMPGDRGIDTFGPAQPVIRPDAPVQKATTCLFPIDE